MVYLIKCTLFLGVLSFFRLFDRTGEDAVPTLMRECIMRIYHDLGAHNALAESCNPVKRRPLVVIGYDTEVMIDLLEGGDDEGGGDPCRSAVVWNEEVCLLSLQSLHLYHELCNAHSKADCQLIIMKRKLAQLSNNLTHLLNRPRHSIQEAAVRQHKRWRNVRVATLYW